MAFTHPLSSFLQDLIHHSPPKILASSTQPASPLPITLSKTPTHYIIKIHTPCDIIPSKTSLSVDTSSRILTLIVEREEINPNDLLWDDLGAFNTLSRCITIPEDGDLDGKGIEAEAGKEGGIIVRIKRQTTSGSKDREIKIKSRL